MILRNMVLMGIVLGVTSLGRLFDLQPADRHAADGERAIDTGSVSRANSGTCPYQHTFGRNGGY